MFIRELSVESMLTACSYRRDSTISGSDARIEALPTLFGSSAECVLSGRIDGDRHASLGPHCVHYTTERQISWMGDGHRSLFRKVKKSGSVGRGRQKERRETGSETRDTPCRNKGSPLSLAGPRNGGPRDKDPPSPIPLLSSPRSIVRASSLNGFKRPPRRQCQRHATGPGQCAPAGRKFWFIIGVALLRDTREIKSLASKNPKYTGCRSCQQRAHS